MPWPVPMHIVASLKDHTQKVGPSIIKGKSVEKDNPLVPNTIPEEAIWDCLTCGACVTECPVDDCMLEVQNPDAPQFIRIEVDPLLCIGCKKCISKGPLDTFLEGCPWDAIDMVSLQEFESEHGELAY